MNIWIIVGFVVMLVLAMGGAILIKGSQYKKAIKGDGYGAIMAILRMTNGFDRCQLEPLTPTGSVNILGGEYFLDEQTSPENDPDKKKVATDKAGWEIKPHFTYYPSNPVFGIKSLQVPVREEIWEQGNSAPLQVFPGRPFMTAGEVAAQRLGAEAHILAKDIKEREAREKQWQKVLLNLPSKMIVYIGLGAIAVGLVYLVIQFMSVASNVSSISVAFGLGG